MEIEMIGCRDEVHGLYKQEAGYMFTFRSGRKKRKVVVQVAVFMVFILIQPSIFASEVPAAGGGVSLAFEAGTMTDKDAPETRFRNELDKLVSVFSMDVDGVDTVTRLEEAINRGEYPGLKSWSYEGVMNGDKITLTWQIEWFDEYAALMAYQDPGLSQKLTKKQSMLLEKCRSIMNTKITMGMTDYEKQLAIHDYIAANCMFDSTLEKMPNVTGDEDAFFAYGALINGTAVCAGYTEAAKLLLDMAGIENYRLDSMEHSWNLVKIDGEYYHMDITWDDPVPDVPGQALHDYFNLTDALVKGYRSHNWLDKEAYPKATATEYNYFVQNNLAANDYDDVKGLLISAATMRREQVTIFVPGDLADGFDWNNNLKFLMELSLKEGSIKKYSYSPPNENKHTLTVLFQY